MLGISFEEERPGSRYQTFSRSQSSHLLWTSDILSRMPSSSVRVANAVQMLRSSTDRPRLVNLVKTNWSSVFSSFMCIERDGLQLIDQMNRWCVSPSMVRRRQIQNSFLQSYLKNTPKGGSRIAVEGGQISAKRVSIVLAEAANEAG